jgi:serine/threonine-protein kinase
MAEVHAARVVGEAGFQKLVAVKCMLPELTDDDEFVQMFLDEARLAANITSPHVVQTFDLGRDQDGTLYIGMELVVGVPLSRLIRSASAAGSHVPIPIAAELLAQAAQGLHDAHEATTPIGEALRIVHRDVSPQNLLVGLDGRLRVTDFGVARAVMRVTKTVGGKIKGKFAYCSPEQLGELDVDQRSDVFSLGIVGWEMLTGRRLFASDHPMQTMSKVQSMRIPTVHELRPDVPKDLSEAIGWALVRDRDKRATTALAFADALRRAVARNQLGVPDREQLRSFVEKAGGEALERISGNIRLALANVEEFRTSDPTGEHPAVEESGSGVVEKVDELAATATADVAANLATPSNEQARRAAEGFEGTVTTPFGDSARLRRPSGPVPAPLPARMTAATPAPITAATPATMSAPPPARNRSVAAAIVIGAGAALAVTAIVVAIALPDGPVQPDGVEAVVIETPPPAEPRPSAPAALPVEPEVRPVEPPAAPIVEPIGNEEMQLQADDRDTPRARRHRRTGRDVAATEPAETTRASAPSETGSQEPRTTRSTPPPEEPAGSGSPRGRHGLVGLDGFERDLQRRNEQ